jgi:DNA-binding NtrC family response regulator
VTPIRRDHKVLVVAPDILLAALVGALVEAANFRAAFVNPGERAEDALARVKPIALVLLDAAAEALSDIFVAQARRRDLPVFLFGSAARIEHTRAWAAERGIPVFVMPRDVERLAHAIDRITIDRRTVDRRSTQGAPEAFSFEDDSGTRWSVYDRRSGDRRRPVERRFVRDDGTTVSCALDEEEARATTRTDLASQLARARPGLS